MIGLSLVIVDVLYESICAFIFLLDMTGLTDRTFLGVN